MDSLFPAGEELPLINWERDYGFVWQDEWAVSPEEVRFALRERRKVNTAPGLDGISAVILKRLPAIMIDRLAECFTACLNRRVFPDQWKIARLILIPKGGPKVPRVPNSIPNARPICLLSEVGKTFERIIVSRLEHYMTDNNVADLSDGQFGFRRGRSTCDALMRVKETIREALEHNNVVLAVGLDIAFNSIPWKSISKTLRWRKRFPHYLCRAIDAYLSNRWIEFIDTFGRGCKRRVLAGVPQGSVLGPILWNLAFDAVVRSQKLPVM